MSVSSVLRTVSVVEVGEVSVSTVPSAVLVDHLLSRGVWLKCPKSGVGEWQS